MYLKYHFEEGSKTAEIFELTGGNFEVQCVIGENCSRGFPIKQYKNWNSAVKYAEKFLNA